MFRNRKPLWLLVPETTLTEQTNLFNSKKSHFCILGDVNNTNFIYVNIVRYKFQKV